MIILPDGRLETLFQLPDTVGGKWVDFAMTSSTAHSNVGDITFGPSAAWYNISFALRSLDLTYTFSELLVNGTIKGSAYYRTEGFFDAAGLTFCMGADYIHDGSGL
jgi:hypothetical protein